MCDKIIRINFFIILLLLFGTVPYSYSSAQDNPEVRAIQLFNSGNYKEAESVLEDLLRENSESPILNYYYGASRTENGHYGNNELEYLKKAGKNITPDRLHYYLAVQYHALQNWDQALKLYNQFRVSVPEMEQKELELGKKIQLCYNQVNPFDGHTAVSSPQNTENASEESAEAEEEEIKDMPVSEEETVVFSASTDTENILTELEIQEQKTDDNFFLPREALPNLPGVKPTIPDGDPVQFQVNNTITYLYTSQFQTTEGKNLFNKARQLQLQQEQNLKDAEVLRKEYKNQQSPEEREVLANKIISLENDSYELEEEIKRTYSESRKVENEYWENADPVSRNNFLIGQEKILSGIKEENPVTPETGEEILIDFIQPEPVKTSKAAPAELVYKIQIGAYSKGVPAYKQRLFKKLSVIRSINNYTDEKGVVVYTTGNLTSFDDALIMRNQIRQEGIQDAIVVPYFKGKRITLEEAKQLENNNDI